MTRLSVSILVTCVLHEQSLPDFDLDLWHPQPRAGVRRSSLLVSSPLPCLLFISAAKDGQIVPPSVGPLIALPPFMSLPLAALKSRSLPSHDTADTRN